MSRKPKSKSISEVLRGALTPVQTGVACFVVRDISVMLHARVLVQQRVLSGAAIADIQFSQPKTIAALYGSGSRGADLTDALVRSYEDLEMAEKTQTVRLDNCRIYSPLCSEGVHVALSKLRAHGCISVEQNVPGVLRDEMTDAIGLLDHETRAKKALALVFLFCPSNTDAASLQKHCDELFIVDKCEPNPGASVAFSITALSLESQHGDAIGRTMYEIRHDEECWSSTSSVFIAAKAEDRAFWYARREGEYLETIAARAGVDKSTVKRRLDQLLVRTDIDADVDLNDDWRDEWFPFLGWLVDDDDRDEDDDSGDKITPCRPKRIV